MISITYEILFPRREKQRKLGRKAADGRLASGYSQTHMPYSISKWFENGVSPSLFWAPPALFSLFSSFFYATETGMLSGEVKMCCHENNNSSGEGRGGTTKTKRDGHWMGREIVRREYQLT